DLSPQADGRQCHATLRSVDRQRTLQPSSERFENGYDSPQFVIAANAVTIRPRAFAADVDQVGPSVLQTQCMVDSRLSVEEVSPIRETVGGHIDDPHQCRSIAKVQFARAQLPRSPRRV